MQSSEKGNQREPSCRECMLPEAYVTQFLNTIVELEKNLVMIPNSMGNCLWRQATGYWSWLIVTANCQGCQDQIWVLR
jgi:hypothetical protein